METLEERNLNRLRNGKMMLEYSKQKRSWGLSFALAVFFGIIGAHRFYWGHKKIGIMIVATTFVVSILFLISQFYGPMFLQNGILIGSALQLFLLSEIVLCPWYTTRVNEQIKSKLKIEYGVKDYKIGV